MTDTTELEKAFDDFLLRMQQPDAPSTLRQKLWLAWKAGAEWTMAEIKKEALKS